MPPFAVSKCVVLFDHANKHMRYMYVYIVVLKGRQTEPVDMVASGHPLVNQVGGKAAKDSTLVVLQTSYLCYILQTHDSLDL